MLTRRRTLRPLALACATAALLPAAAQARPAAPDAPTKAIAPQPEPIREQIVREIRTDGDTQLALILSGSALLIAAGGAGLAGRDHRRLNRIA